MKRPRIKRPIDPATGRPFAQKKWLVELEQRILLLESTRHDPELIEELRQAAHTIRRSFNHAIDDFLKDLDDLNHFEGCEFTD